MSLLLLSPFKLPLENWKTYNTITKFIYIYVKLSGIKSLDERTDLINLYTTSFYFINIRTL